MMSLLHSDRTVARGERQPMGREPRLITHLLGGEIDEVLHGFDRPYSHVEETYQLSIEADVPAGTNAVADPARPDHRGGNEPTTIRGAEMDRGTGVRYRHGQKSVLEPATAYRTPDLGGPQIRHP